MGCNTTHHLHINGPASQLDAARRAWLNDGPFSDRAAAEHVRERPEGPNDVPATAAWPGLWISFEGRGAQVQAVDEFAARYPALTLDLVWYDYDIDAGEHYQYEDGEGDFVQEFDYAAAYEYVYGEADPLLVGDDNETEADEGDKNECHQADRNLNLAAYDEVILRAGAEIANLTRLVEDMKRTRDSIVSARSRAA